MMDDDFSIIESDGEGHGDDPQYTELRIIGRDLVSFDVTRFGSFIKRIDLSFNYLKLLQGLNICCETLEELVLDNNQLERLDLGAVFPRLDTISLNKNRIWHISALLTELQKYATSLRFLSLLSNPGSPDQLTSDYVDDDASEYPRFRCHILHHLPTIRFLDHRPVTQSELAESRKAGYANVKFATTYTPLPSSTRLGRVLSRSATAFATANDDGSAAAPDSADAARTPTHTHVIIPHVESPTGSVTPIVLKTRSPHSSKQGKRLIKYIGKNSEGNRFIKDTDL